MGKTARHSLVLALAASIFALGLSGLAAGQDRGGRGRARRERGGAPEEHAPTKEHAPERDGEAREGAEPDAPETGDEVDARSEIVEAGGEKVKAIRFSGLDVAGRLKSPQLLYFLNRLRAEFDRPRLPHRSFLPELDRSSRTESF